MVVTAQHIASAVGAGILAAGGNAIDAAVAVGYALAVVEPCCGNIGGGGFMTLHLADGRDSFINFRETAPAAASAGNVSRPGRQARPRGEPLRLARHRRAGDGAGARPRAARIRQSGARGGDGAGDRLGPRRLCAEPGRRPAARRQGRAISARSGGRENISAARRRPVPARRPPRAKRPRDDARGDRAGGAGRLLQRTRRRGGRAGEPGQWRHPDRARFCRLYGDRRAAAVVLLPRLPDPLGATAELGRHDDLRNPEYSRRLRHKGDGLAPGALGRADGRCDEPRLRRPQ